MIVQGDTRLPARFWAKVGPPTSSGCWEWTSGPQSSGYGTFYDDGETRLAHRVAYAALVGPIPEKHQIDHVRARGCVSRLCVNPAHLEAVTQQENIARGSRPTATHCRRGHEYTPENTRIHSSKGRQCRACGREDNASHHARRRAAS